MKKINWLTKIFNYWTNKLKLKKTQKFAKKNKKKLKKLMHLILKKTKIQKSKQSNLRKLYMRKIINLTCKQSIIKFKKSKIKMKTFNKKFQV